MIQTWEEEMRQGREVREPSPVVVRVDADYIIQLKSFFKAGEDQ